jgi:hypothetical protein
VTGELRILVANTPASYREVHAEMLRALRPQAAIFLSDPAELDTAVARLQPHLVLCSALTETLRAQPLAWLLLYPEGENRAVASVGGRERAIAAVAVADVLAVVDEAREWIDAELGIGS